MELYKIILWVFYYISVVYGCPPDEDIGPHCSCKDFSESTIMFCHNLMCPDEFTIPIKVLAHHHTNLYSLSIFNSSLLYVPDDIFKGTHIEQIRFVNSQIMSFSESDVAFHGLEDTLSELRTINSEFFTQWDWNQLRKLHKLKLIDVDSADLGAIEQPFPCLPTLESLGIIQAKISYLVDSAFANLPRLTIFNMKENDISELKRNIFPNPAEYLENIDLSYNKIYYLPEDFFSNMPNLERVALDENKFTTLYGKTFQSAFKTLMQLTMTGNAFRCDCRIAWLTETRFPLEFTAECASPATLKNTQLKHVDVKQLFC